MTKRLDPEIKALRAINRALAPLDEASARRSLEWFLAREYRQTWFSLPIFKARAASTSATGEEHDDANS